MYKRILIVVDAREVSQAAVSQGTALAAAHDAEVVFFSVLPSYVVPYADMPVFADVSPKEFDRDAKAAADKLLATAGRMAENAGVMWYTARAGGEDAAKLIVDVARRRGCDMIVVASEGRNAVLRLLMGSVIPGLITAAPMPVMVVKQGSQSVGKRAAVVVPLKGKKAAKRVAAVA